MSLDVIKKIMQKLIIIGIGIAIFSPQIILGEFPTNYSRSDPIPMYSTLDPHEFLYRKDRQFLKEYGYLPCSPLEWFSVVFSPFAQAAQQGVDANNNIDNLGDIIRGAPWDMLTLLFGPAPAGQTLAMRSPTLAVAKSVLFPNIPPNGVIDDGSIVDTMNQKFGFFTIDAHYKKKGVRFEFNVRFLENVGLTVQTGISDICLHVRSFTDLTDSIAAPNPSQFPQVTAANVTTYLMKEYISIFRELGYNIDDYHIWSFEDTRVKLFWRYAYLINKDSRSWPEYLCIPFIELGASFPTSKEWRPDLMFAEPFGNKNHTALGARIGINLDFTDTVEIGGEFGFTHFFAKQFANYQVPNSNYQSGVYPFVANTLVKPGNNWHLGLKLDAYHFLEKLSFYLQYIMLIHEHDHFEITPSDPAFVPHVIKNFSTFKVQVANVGFNYDISPNAIIGFLWQAPLAERAAFKSTTLVGSLAFTY